MTQLPCPSRLGRNRAVAHRGVQRVAVGQAAGEGVQGPAAAGDPFLVGVLTGVGGDQLDIPRCRHGLAQVAMSTQLNPGEQRVSMRVDEPGEQGSAPARSTTDADPAGPAGSTAVNARR